MKYTELEIKAALKDYLRDFPLDRCVAVTLTMKQNNHGQRLDRISASQNFRHFTNCLNKHYFGNSAARYNKRLAVFPVIEYSQGKRFHYHLMQERKAGESDSRFRDVVQFYWANTKFGYKEICYKPRMDFGWVDYMLKEHDSSENVDWENFHNPR